MRGAGALTDQYSRVPGRARWLRGGGGSEPVHRMTPHEPSSPRRYRSPELAALLRRDTVGDDAPQRREVGFRLVSSAEPPSAQASVATGGEQ